MTVPFFLIAAALALAVPAGASVADGVQKWRAGDWAGALANWQGPAGRGDPDALFNMGQAYRLGRGVAPNNQTALDFYRKAADKGHLAATANLGITLFQDGRRTEAMTWLKQAADRGDPRASYVMGIATFNGDGAARIPVLGYAYMIRARDGGMAQADQQAARMATLLTPAERGRAEAVAAALAAGEAVPAELLDTGGKAAPTAAATEPELAPGPAPAETADADSAPDAMPEVPRVVTRAAPAASAAPAIAAPAIEARKAPRAQWRVQLGAYQTEAAARSAWTTIVRGEPALLKSQDPLIEPRGRLVTLQVGAFAEREGARDLCAALAKAGRTCFVVGGQG